jgi:signal peptidase I
MHPTAPSPLGTAAGLIEPLSPATQAVLTLARIAKLALEAAALIILVLLFFLRVPQVSGHSMEPQLRAGEHVLINTLAYAMRIGDGARPLIEVPFRPIARGDVIAFVHASDDGRAVYVKRVVGVPGDDLIIQHGVVWVNGARLDEPYVSRRDAAGSPAMTVPRDAFFVLGDNRGESDDSRAFGAVPESAVIGRATFVVWPLNRAGPIR